MNNIRLGRRARSRHLSRRSVAALLLSGGCMGAVGVTFSTDALEVQGPGDESTTTETTDPDDTSTTDPDDTSTTDPDDTSTTDPDDTSTTDPGDTSTTDPGDTSTSTDPSSTSTIESSTSVPGATQPTTSPATGTSVPAGSFEALLATQCAGQLGQPVLAEELEELRGGDGSGRIVQIVETCDVVFTGDVVVDLGRPTTNVEAMIDDPANDVTPNQPQIDVLNSELALYWRIAQDVLAQAGLGDATAASSVETTVPASSAGTGPDTSSAGTGPTTSSGSSTSSSTTP